MNHIVAPINSNTNTAADEGTRRAELAPPNSLETSKTRKHKHDKLISGLLPADHSNGSKSVKTTRRAPEKKG